MDEEKSLDEVTDLHQHFDVLREISNIGSGNAATALANLLNRKVNVGIPKVSFLEFSKVADEMGGSENILVGILVSLQNEIQGMMMFLMTVESANVLISSMMGTPREKSDMQFSEIELSLIEEVGNILSGSYLSSLSSLTSLNVKPSIPYLSIDMAGAILSVPAIEFGKIGDKALFIESKLGSDDGDTDKDIIGYFLLVPEFGSFDVILRSLGVI